MEKTSKQNSKKSFWKQARRLWKPFVFLFFVLFVVWNWNEVFWIFNYRIIFEKVISPFVEAKKMLTNEQSLTENYQAKEGRVEIPKINIEAPIVFINQTEGETLEEKDFQDYLKKGVVHYPNSALPGQGGAAVILGHSAPTGWPRINYDWVFNDINTLEPGDEILIYIDDDKQFTYKVTKKLFLAKGEEISSLGLTSSKPVLILISCWPPGKDKERIGVEAVLVD